MNPAYLLEPFCAKNGPIIDRVSAAARTADTGVLLEAPLAVGSSRTTFYTWPRRLHILALGLFANFVDDADFTGFARLAWDISDQDGTHIFNTGEEPRAITCSQSDQLNAWRPWVSHVEPLDKWEIVVTNLDRFPKLASGPTVSPILLVRYVPVGYP